MEEKNNQGFELDDIIKEVETSVEAPEEMVDETDAMHDAAFVEWLQGDEQDEQAQAQITEEQAKEAPAEEPPSQEQEISVDLQATRRMDPVHLETAVSETTGDTIRLDSLHAELEQLLDKEVPGERITEEEDWRKGDTIRSEPFSAQWEPEYEQPMGEYIPPQPIQFQPRSRLHELKKKLVEGPEKCFYDLSEKGVGRLQAAIFLSVLVALISAASTAMYAVGMVQPDRLRLMVFGQFFALLVSALLGSYQLIDGINDLMHRRFTLNTLLCVTFLVCCVDGVLCLMQVRVPCCAAFSLQVTMSLWGTYQRRSREISQMDTMRKAIRLDGVAVCPDYMDGKKGLLRTEGQVEDFMDNYAAPGKPELRLNIYSFVAMWVALAVGVFAGVMEGFSAGVQVAAVSLLAAVPATAFICHTRPAWVLERRLHKLGTVLCGWQGVEAISGKAAFPISYTDLFPADAIRLNGMKFFGSREPDQVIGYAAAVINADGCGLGGLFTQILDSRNGLHYEAYDLAHYENGGMAGVVDGETVLVGSASFMKEMEIEVPENARVSYGVYVAIEGELTGLFAVSYEATQSATAGLTTLNAYRTLRCVLVSDDFMLTHGFLRNKFGIKLKRLFIPSHEDRDVLRRQELPQDAPAAVMTTALGLAPLAFGVTGGRTLKTACNIGTVLHMIGGIVGLAIMVLLVVLGALDLLTPINMFLYQLVWMIPALLITEWTRTI